MKKFILPACLLLLYACTPKEKEQTTAVAEAPAQETNKVFAWLHGKWMIDYGDTKVYENWEQQNSTLLTGTGYVVAGPDTVVRETMQIQQIGGVWVFIAKVNDHDPVLFSSKQNEPDNQLVFRNPEHDYPQQITYGSEANGKLFAIVEGNEKGKNKKEEYRFVRY